MPLPRLRIRTLVLVAGITLWLLVAGVHARAIITCIFLIALAMLGFAVNNREGYGDVLLLIALLAVAPFVLIGIYFAPIWREAQL